MNDLISFVEDPADGSAPRAGTFERLSRHDGALRPGDYWRARRRATFIEPYEDTFAKKVVLQKTYTAEKGEVLLLTDVKRDGAAGAQHDHTVQLLTHPKYGEGEHVHMRVAHFLNRFEPILDADRVRAEEMAAINFRIQAITDDISEAQRNPDYLNAQALRALAQAKAASDDGDSAEDEADDEGGEDRFEGEGVPAEAPATANLPAVNGDLNVLNVLRVESPSLTSALAGRNAALAVQQTLDMVNSAKALAEAHGQWFQGRTNALVETTKALTPFFMERAAAAVAKTKSAIDRATVLLESVSTLTLFTGDKVSVLQCRDGEPAPAGTPVHLYQQRLFVDEEMSYLTKYVGLEIDANGDDKFFEALKSPRMLDLLIPAQRGIVLMGYSRQHRSYLDLHPLAAVQLKQKNISTWLLVRDGDRVFMVDSPVESHCRAEMLFPDKDVNGAFFTGIDGNQISPEDLRWTETVDEFKQAVTHYRRFAVLIAGLVAREAFFSGVNYMDLFEAGKTEGVFRLVRDAVGDALEDNRGGIDQYFRWANGGLAAGSRVVVDFEELANDHNTPGAYSSGEKRWVPHNRFALATITRDGETMHVSTKYHRNWRSGEGERSLRTTVFSHGKWQLSGWKGLLCVDRIDVSELDRLMASRRERRQFTKYMGLFRAARHHAEALALDEGPLRAWITESLVAAGLATVEEGERIVVESLAAWRAEFDATPRMGDPEATKLLDRVFGLTEAGRWTAEEVAGAAAGAGVEPLRLSLDATGRAILYAVPRQPDNRGARQAEVDRWVLKRGKRAIALKDCLQVPLRTNESAHTRLHEWPAAKEWILDGILPAPLRRKQLLIGEIEQNSPARLAYFGAGPSEELGAWLVKAYTAARTYWWAKTKYRPLLVWRVPIGILSTEKMTHVLCLSESMSTLMARLVPEGGESRATMYKLLKADHQLTNASTAVAGFDGIRLTVIPQRKFNQDELIVSSEWSGDNLMENVKGETGFIRNVNNVPLGRCHEFFKEGFDHSQFCFIARDARRPVSVWLAPCFNLDDTEPFVSGLIRVAKESPVRV